MTVKLDENQKKAVEHFEGPALVVAGPGSGKTTVIIKRILNLVHKHNVDPANILAIAFTNAAADEMMERFRKSDLNRGEPTICTLHAFGKNLITNHYEEAGFSQKPKNIWEDKKIEKIIDKEKSWLNIENEEKPVAIYKFEGRITGRCYIGQTRNPKRREKEHRTDRSKSNRWLHDALKKGDEQFDFTYEWVKGSEADKEESYRINSHRNRVAVNLNKKREPIEKKDIHIPITVYKIKPSATVTCYFGQTTDIENIDKPEGFKIICEEQTREEADKCIEREIEKYKELVVFNREDPLYARDSTRRRIEVFCEYFDVPYDEVLEHTQKFEHEMRKFNRMNEDIIKVKSKVETERFRPEKINDPILRAFAERYEARKTEARAIDFLDMLILSANMLEKNPDILREYEEKYRYVFVDEFQDISPVDFRLIKLFRDNLFAVGDDDQAIYGFRGGDSEIMQKFCEKEDVTEYKVTRNYRSFSNIVRHAKALIEHNSERIFKNLRAQKSARSRIEVLKASQDTIQGDVRNELFPIVTTSETHFKENTPNLDNPLLQELTIPQEIGILARNWYEVRPTQTHLNSVLKNKGFQIRWSDSDEKEKRKLIMQRNQTKIEISTIHSAKGQEWDKVILLINNYMKKGLDGKPKPSIPDPRNAVEDERRLFYVAVTRAKQELVILDGGSCQFVPEFQNTPLTKEDIEHAFREELARQIPKFKKDLEKASTEALVAFQHKRKSELEKASNAARKQNEVKFNQLRSNITQAENTTAEMEAKLPIALKTANKNLLEDLIPVLDEFEALFKNLPEVDQSNNTTDYTTLIESTQLTQEQLCISLEGHRLEPIEVSQGEIFNPTYHEEISSPIYSEKVPAGRIAKIEQHGYLFNDHVIRKAQVVISKKKQKADILLSQDFAQPVRFVTYTNTNFYDLRHIEVFKDKVRGSDSKNSKVQLQKLNILFAFPKEDMTSLKSHIKRRRPIADQNLQPIELISERFHVEDDILKSLLIKQDTSDFDDQDSTVQFVTRSGHVLSGHLSDFDEDFLYMQVNKKIVVVYRDGILKLKNITWDEIRKAYKNGTTINGHIIARVPRGFTVRFQLIDGFLPESEVAPQRVRNLDLYVGRTLEMKVIQISTSRNRIVFSHRAWLEDLRTQFLTTLEIGQTITGTVKNIKDFGAFVDLGGVDGLLHKSEMAWRHVNHPSEIVAVGENIEVKVIEFDRENEKISLSLKQLTSNPWENAEEKYPVGSTIRGIVTNVVNYGAFVQLEEGIDGLIHISEMSTDSRDVLPSDIVNKGDEVEVVVIKISKNSRRISLSMIASLPRSVEDPYSAPISDSSAPTEKIKGAIPDDLSESITITPTEDTEDPPPIPEESSFKGEANGGTLCSPMNLTDTQDIKETVDSAPSMPKELTKILNSQIQNLKSEPIKTEVSPEPGETVSANPQLTPQESNEILKRHIQNLKPALPEEDTNSPINTTNNTSDQPIESIDSEPSEQTRNSPSSVETSHEEELPKDESQDKRKKLRFHLRKFGRYALRKLKRD